MYIDPGPMGTFFSFWVPMELGFSGIDIACHHNLFPVHLAAQMTQKLEVQLRNGFIEVQL